MKKISANTLEAALLEASRHFNCSLTQIHYEVVQHPSSGLFGLWKKEAIIVATKKQETPSNESTQDTPKTQAQVAPQQTHQNTQSQTDTKTDIMAQYESVTPNKIATTNTKTTQEIPTDSHRTSNAAQEAEYTQYEVNGLEISAPQKAETPNNYESSKHESKNYGETKHYQDSKYHKEAKYHQDSKLHQEAKYHKDSKHHQETRHHKEAKDYKESKDYKPTAQTHNQAHSYNKEGKANQDNRENGAERMGYNSMPHARYETTQTAQEADREGGFTHDLRPQNSRIQDSRHKDSHFQDSRHRDSYSQAEEYRDKHHERREYKKPYQTSRAQSDFDIMFYDKESSTSQKEVWQNKSAHSTQNVESICQEVQDGLKELLQFLPLELSKIQVKPYDEHTLFILIDGLDAALLIGQKGYRYKSLSYLLFNWIHTCYGYGVRLEIAQFLKNQEEMMRVYLEPIIESAKIHGKAQTKPLDGILTHIALKMLRDALPNKYIVFRETAEGEKYITISEFLHNPRNSVHGFGSFPKY